MSRTMQVALIAKKPLKTLVDLADRENIPLVIEDRLEVMRMFKEATKLIAPTSSSIRLINTNMASRLLEKAGCPLQATFLASLNKEQPGTTYNKHGHLPPPVLPPPEQEDAPPQGGITARRDPAPRALLAAAPGRRVQVQAPRQPATDMAGRFMAMLRQRDGEVRRDYSVLPMPAEVPEYDLDDEQKVGDYGLTGVASAALERQTNDYIGHCLVDINPNRGDAYAAPIQTMSVHGTRQVIKGFLGFCNEYRGVPIGELRLSLFANPDHIIHFVGFLKARDVSKAQLAKQVCAHSRLRDVCPAPVT